VFSSVHRRHAQNLAPLLPPQLRTHDAVDPRADGVPGLVDQHAGVVVKLDDAPVAALRGVLGPHHHGVPDVASLDLVAGRHAGQSVGLAASLLLDDDDDSVPWRSQLPAGHSV